MAGPKPTLGYPTRTAAVQALRAEGKVDAGNHRRHRYRHQCRVAL